MKIWTATLAPWEGAKVKSKTLTLWINSLETKLAPGPPEELSLKSKKPNERLDKEES